MNILYIISLTCFILEATAHMAIRMPCPRYNAHGIDCPELPPNTTVDWTQIEPIGTSDKIFYPLCKHPVPYKNHSAVWRPGQAVDIEFHGKAAHSGGHSEFSISYDNATTFVVVHQELRYMFMDGRAPWIITNLPRQLKYSFKLPDGLPGSDNAVFAWSWVNASGNREFYMNCVDVKIEGPPGTFSGKPMTVANYGPGYPEIPEFGRNYETGIELFTINFRNVTVEGPGNSY